MPELTIKTFRVMDKATGKLLHSCASRTEAVEKRMEIKKRDAKHGNKRVISVVKHEKEATRGRDLSKLDVKWEAPELVKTLSNGWDFVYLYTDADVLQLGELMGHCATMPSRRNDAVNKHFFFFTVLDEKGTPHCTAHARNANSYGKQVGETGPAYDYAARELGWGLEFTREEPKTLTWEEWEAEQRPVLQKGLEQHKTFYIAHYGKDYLSQEYFIRQLTPQKANYEYYVRQIKAQKPSVIRPAVLGEHRIIMLSCYAKGDYYGQSEGKEYIQEIKKWYLENLDSDSEPLETYTPYGGRAF